MAIVLLSGCLGRQSPPPATASPAPSGAEAFGNTPEDPAWRAERDRTYRERAAGSSAAPVIAPAVLAHMQYESIVESGGVPDPHDPGAQVPAPAQASSSPPPAVPSAAPGNTAPPASNASPRPRSRPRR